VQRIYLDELGDVASDSLGVKIVKLVIEAEQTALEQARHLIDQAQVEITDETIKRNLIDLIETIIVYKLPQKSRQEIEAMLGLSELKQTKVYQEAKQEGLTEGRQEGELKAKLTAIPRMIEFGLSVEQIAQLQDLPVEVVQQASRLFHQQNVAAFVELLNNQRSLFSQQDLAALVELIQPLPDKIEDLSYALAQWCKQEGHAPLLILWHQIRAGLLMATVEKLLGKHSDTQETPSVPVNKAMVQNAIELGESFE